MPGKHVLFYEGGCTICERFIAWVRRRGGDKVFEIYSYQTAPKPLMDPVLRQACKKALHVLTIDGKKLRGARATLFVLENTGWGGAARFLQFPPLIWLGEAFYYLIAWNRKWLGKLLR